MSPEEIFDLEVRMVKALDGKPMSSKADRLAAYRDVGIVFDDLTSEEIDARDAEAASIALLKRFA